MTDHPVLANRAMVRTILDRTKTQTRRPIKAPPGVDVASMELGWHHPTRQSQDGTAYPGPEQFGLSNEDHCLKSPFGGPSDRLWLRERQRVIVAYIGNDGSFEIRVRYEADGAESDWLPWPERLRGRPVVGKCLSMGGYRESSRITLAVKRVRIERLQDISEEDARAEGAEWMPSHPGNNTNYICTFVDLWGSCYPEGGFGWTENPQVWACEFELIETEKTRKS